MDENTDQTYQPPAPHRYVPPAVRQWRTCASCGQGANAQVHRHGI